MLILIIFFNRNAFSQNSISIDGVKYNIEKKENRSYIIKNGDTLIFVFDKMPKYPGGHDKMIRFIQKNLCYPKTALKENVSGQVIIKFMVNCKGLVDSVQVIENVRKDLDDEALRVIRLMPRWRPGKLGNKPIDVWYEIPINFAI